MWHQGRQGHQGHHRGREQGVQGDQTHELQGGQTQGFRIQESAHAHTRCPTCIPDTAPDLASFAAASAAATTPRALTAAGGAGGAGAAGRRPLCAGSLTALRTNSWRWGSNPCEAAMGRMIVLGTQDFWHARLHGNGV